jgi:hypothetical protein
MGNESHFGGLSILTARIDALEEQLTGNLGDIEVNNLTINQGLNIHGSEGNNVLTGALLVGLYEQLENEKNQIINELN